MLSRLRIAALTWVTVGLLLGVVPLVVGACGRAGSLQGQADQPASPARTAVPTAVTSPSTTTFAAGDCTLAPGGSTVRIHANDDIVVQVPAGWTYTTNVGRTETVLIRFTASGAYSNSPTTMEIASLIGKFKTAREGAQYFAHDPGINTLLDCQISGGKAAFFRSTDGGQTVYRFFVVHNNLLYMVTLAGSGGFDSRAIADTKSLLGSWSWIS